MNKTIDRIELAAQPPHIQDCFEILREAAPGAPFALFGGAVRDAHYAAYWDKPSKLDELNDYDLRIWMPEDNHAEHTRAFVERLGEVAGRDVEYRPSLGTGAIRYYLTFPGVMEMDVSVRTPKGALRTASVAIERAGEADAGLSSVAIASDGTAWATPEFKNDVENRTITMYPRPNSGNRIPEYAQHMQAKFPDHTVVWI